MSNSLDPDQAQDAGLDLDVNSLQRDKEMSQASGPNRYSFTPNTGIWAAQCENLSLCL